MRSLCIVTLNAALAATVAASVAGCLPSSDTEDAPMCYTTADCAAGKTCDEGLCWGNPPPGPFAAVLVPPGEGWPKLATTEITEIAIAADGWVDDLRFAETALVSGRVVLACGADDGCDAEPGVAADVSIDAQVTFSRPSLIPGRPDYTRTVTSVAGVTGNEPSFTVALPLSDVPYQVLVTPGRGGSATPASASPSELAPPLRTLVDVTGDRTVEWVMGDPTLHKVVTGSVVDAAGRGLSGMQVVALGKADETAERSSSLATTDADGHFSLRIPLGLESSHFDLVVTPLAPGPVPTLVVSEVDIPDPVNGEVIELPQLLQMPSVAVTASFTIPIRGRNSTGDEVPVRGAAVRLTTELTAGLPANSRATFSASTFTDDSGNAVLDLLPGDVMGNRVYTASVEPLPTSEHATLHGHPIEVGPGMGLLASVQLQRRVAVGSAVIQADGQPAYHAMVAARIAPAFRDALTAESRAVVDNLQLPAASTDISGRFVLWLDAELAGQTALYDLEITPADPLMPLWTVPSLDMNERPTIGGLEFATITLPAPSYARGLVFAPEDAASGAIVPKAGLRLYELVPRADCGAAACPPAALFRGLATSREDGLIRLILPDAR